MRFVKIVFVLLIPFLIVSCSKEVQDTKAYRFAGNGLIYDNYNGELYTGPVSVSSSVIMHYEVVDGKRNGSFLVYYKNGNLAQSGYLINNRNEGEWKYYYPNGNPESNGMYKNDVAQGTWTFYYDDGALKEEGEIKDGKRYGRWMLYNEQGNVKNVFYFLEGNIVEELKNG